MKSVLIVDAPTVLREFLKEKLTAEKVFVESADAQRDALTKFLSLLPDLVILNVEHSVSDVMEFLEKKQADPNGKKIPVIMSGPLIEHDEVSDLVQFGVIKYFTKPIKFDMLFDSIGRVLHSDFAIDTTPCVLDLHLSKDIIFIEVAMGLNREKISLLKYKLPEIIESNALSVPKVILIMTSLSLSYVDGLNLELLLSNITAGKKISRRNIKILSLDPFVSDFIDGHRNFSGIQVAQSISEVLPSLLSNIYEDSDDNVVSEKFLSASGTRDPGDMQLRFSSDTGTVGEDEELVAGALKIAIIDSDNGLAQSLKQVVEAIGEVTLFHGGKEFMDKIQPNQFDLAITGMEMPHVTGLDVLKHLIDNRINLPVIVYSAVARKEVIMQTLRFGASCYLIKPQPAEVIVQKALEIINAKR